MLLIEPSLRENKSLNSYKHNSSEPKLPVVQLTETVQKKKEKKRKKEYLFKEMSLKHACITLVELHSQRVMFT